MNQETRSRDILNTLKDVAEGHYTPAEGFQLIMSDLEHSTPQPPAPEPAKWDSPQGHKADCGFVYGRECTCGWSAFCNRKIQVIVGPLPSSPCPQSQ
jgi:hypothetical protein